MLKFIGKLSFRKFITGLAAILCALAADAQILVTGGGDLLDADSVKRDFSNQPYFGMYKDNYFIFGLPWENAPPGRTPTLNSRFR